MTVRPASGEVEVARAIAVLCDAFSTDPAMSWFLPHLDPDARRRRLPNWFAALIRGVHELRVSDDGRGAALWRPPGRTTAGFAEQLRQFPVGLRTYGRHPVRAARGIAVIEEGHPTDPHWYLDYIGVAATARGGGVGGALMAEGVARADADGVGAYLNASSEGSRRLYERHGFVVTEAYHLPYEGPPQWKMWRAPTGA